MSGDGWHISPGNPHLPPPRPEVNAGHETAPTSGTEITHASGAPAVAAGPLGSSHDPRASLPPGKTDPLAAALGNATLLGVGYLLQRRWLLASCATVVSITLMVITATAEQPAWPWRVTLLVWWLAMIVHGWWTARPRTPSPIPHPTLWPLEPVVREKVTVRQHRLVAAATAMAVLAGFAVVTIDGRLIEASAASAHESGDCTEATKELDRIGARHHLVDPFVAQRTQGSREACELLLAALHESSIQPEAASDLLAEYVEHPSALWPGAFGMRVGLLLLAAEGELDQALEAGTPSNLPHAMTLLRRVLELDSDREADVEQVVDAYVKRLPGIGPCDARDHIDWVTRNETLDGVSEKVAAIAPSVLVDCGNELLEAAPHNALEVYQTVLDHYPEADLAEAAREGVGNAETRIEELALRDLFNRDPGAYCDDPLRYRRAPAYKGKGPHQVVVARDADSRRAEDASGWPWQDLEADGLLDKSLPSQWTAKEVTDATLVLCATGPEYGRSLESCSYMEQDSGRTFTVTQHTQQVRIEAFELRTGKRAFELELQLGSYSCPDTLRYRQSDVPKRIFASVSKEAIRSALRPKIQP